jgi:sialic acid synthase SpsE
VGGRAISDGEPVYVIGEVGINHNASTNVAKKLIEGAVAAKCLTPAQALATGDAVGSGPTCR